MSLFGGDPKSSPPAEPTHGTVDSRNEHSQTAAVSGAQPRATSADLSDAESQYQPDEVSIGGLDSGVEEDVEEDEGEPREQRPNRYSGPQSNWLRWTAPERGLAISFDQGQANDLSIHLYNAHALRRRLYSPERIRNARPWQRRDNWLRESTGDDLVADNDWTAWPLLPERVPRSTETFGQPPDDGLEGWTLKQKRRWKLSEGLEELLLAGFLREARRNLRDSHGADNATKGEEVQDERQQPVSVDEEVRQSDPNSIQGSSLALSPGSATGRRSNDESAPQTRQGNPRSASHRASLENASNSTLGEPDQDPQPQRSTEPKNTDTPQADPWSPVPLADDEKALRILRPTIRSHLNHLDNLLLGLHYARKTHSRKRRKFKDDSTGDRGGYEDSEVERAPGLRDWSEVLSTAALVGVKSGVVQRAAKRCSALFGEEMGFRTLAFDEDPAQNIPESSAASTPSRRAHQGDRTATTSTWDSTAVLCPHEDCPKHTRPYSRPSALNKHMKKRHGYDPKAEKPPDSVELPEIVGGVHVDGFMQPISARQGWRGRDRSESGKRRKKRRVDVDRSGD